MGPIRTESPCGLKALDPEVASSAVTSHFSIGLSRERGREFNQKGLGLERERMGI